MPFYGSSAVTVPPVAADGAFLADTLCKSHFIDVIYGCEAVQKGHVLHRGSQSLEQVCITLQELC